MINEEDIRDELRKDPRYNSNWEMVYGINIKTIREILNDFYDKEPYAYKFIQRETEYIKKFKELEKEMNRVRDKNDYLEQEKRFLEEIISKQRELLSKKEIKK